MKKIFSVFSLLIAMSILHSGIMAQFTPGFGACKVILKSGDLAFLKSEKKINLQYDYSTLKVGAYNSEEDFVKDKVKDLNEKEKGKGDKWRQSWDNAKNVRYKPKFEELFNKGMAKINISASEGAAAAKYTLIVKNTFIEPGFNVGVMKKPAFANFEFVFIETANPQNKVAELYLNNVIGSQAMGYDFDVDSRVAESFAKAGKMLAAFLVKGTK
jgi:hypothetical protein